MLKQCLYLQIADIWSCGVMLYVMLVGAYPFERPEDKHDNQKLQKMIQVGWLEHRCLLPSLHSVTQLSLSDCGDSCTNFVPIAFHRGFCGWSTSSRRTCGCRASARTC